MIKKILIMLTLISAHHAYAHTYHSHGPRRVTSGIWKGSTFVPRKILHVQEPDITGEEVPAPHDQNATTRVWRFGTKLPRTVLGVED